MWRVTEPAPAPLPGDVTARPAAPVTDPATAPTLLRLPERARWPVPTWPRTFVIGLLKGGVGKSWTAVYLALLLYRLTGQRVLLVDADPRSQTTNDWVTTARLRGHTWPDGVVVVSWPVEDLAARVRQVRGDYVHVVIDTGGASEQLLVQALLAGAAERLDPTHPTRVVYGADLLCPFAASEADYRLLPATRQTAANVSAIVKVRMRALLTKVGPRGWNDLDVRVAREAIEGAGIPVMDPWVSNRKQYTRAFATVLPEGPGQYEHVLADLLTDEPIATRELAA